MRYIHINKKLEPKQECFNCESFNPKAIKAYKCKIIGSCPAVRDKLIYEQFPICSEKDITDWYKEASDFIDKTGFYSSMRSDAICAVVEYIAYKNCFTIRGIEE